MRFLWERLKLVVEPSGRGPAGGACCSGDAPAGDRAAPRPAAGSG